TLPGPTPSKGFWTQSGTNAIWVVPTNAFEARAGSRVRIKGATAHGSLLPVFVGKANIAVLGPGAMPEPLRLPVTHLFRPEFFGRWIEQEGVVSSVAPHGTYYQMFLAAADLPVDVHFYALPGDSSPVAWKNHRYRMQGVCVAGLDAEGRVFGFEM